MPCTIDEITAGRLERVAPRASKIFGGPPAGGTVESAGGGQESSTNAGPPNAVDIKAIATQLKHAAASGPPASKVLAGRDVNAESDMIAAQLVAKANEVLAQLRGGAPTGDVSAEGAYALEAVLRVRGRPALNVEGDSIEVLDAQKFPGSDFWLSFRSDNENQLVRVADATGAVMVKDRMGLQRVWVQGTAWLVKPNLVMTNRHVLFPPLGGTRLARRIPGATTTAQFKSDLEITINFTFDNRSGGGSVTAPALDVVYVSEQADPIDVALIRIGTPIDVTQKLSDPLVVASTSGDFQYLYVVGHPGKMLNVPENVLAVFGTPDERKRVSFGETMDVANSRPIELTHDASTIGGFSGGCVLPFRSHEVVGLHYYGDPLNGNRAFTVDALRAHAVGKLLWVN